jgi:hypothetical protein
VSDSGPAGAIESRFDEATHGDRPGGGADPGASGADEQLSCVGRSGIKSAGRDPRCGFLRGDGCYYELVAVAVISFDVNDVEVDIDDNSGDDTIDCAQGDGDDAGAVWSDANVDCSAPESGCGG